MNGKGKLDEEAIKEMFCRTEMKAVRMDEVYNQRKRLFGIAISAPYCTYNICVPLDGIGKFIRKSVSGLYVIEGAIIGSISPNNWRVKSSPGRIERIMLGLKREEFKPKNLNDVVEIQLYYRGDVTSNPHGYAHREFYLPDGWILPLYNQRVDRKKISGPGQI